MKGLSREDALAMLKALSVIVDNNLKIWELCEDIPDARAIVEENNEEIKTLINGMSMVISMIKGSEV